MLAESADVQLEDEVFVVLGAFQGKFVSMSSTSSPMVLNLFILIGLALWFVRIFQRQELQNSISRTNDKAIANDNCFGVSDK